MVQDQNKGGLRAPSIETMAKSLNLAWISRFLKSMPTRDDESWRVIPNHFLDKYGGLNFLLCCVMIRIFLIRCVSLTSISGYYFFSQNLKFLIIRNFASLSGSQPVFYRSWLNKNVFLVQDLLGDDGKVLSYSEFFRKFQLNGNLLQIYMQVVSAIPKDLINDAWRYHIDKTSILSESSFQLSADLSLDLLIMKNRNYYWLLTSKDQHEINAIMKWERDFLSEKNISPV